MDSNTKMALIWLKLSATSGGGMSVSAVSTSGDFSNSDINIAGFGEMFSLNDKSLLTLIGHITRLLA